MELNVSAVLKKDNEMYEMGRRRRKLRLGKRTEAVVVGRKERVGWVV
jgi:hypothetical protein